MTWYFLSCRSFTIAVSVDADGKIAEAAPIARRFIGQSAKNLGRWMRSIGGFEAVRLDP